MAQRKMTPEGYVKQAVMEYLAVMHIFCLRTNSGTQVIQDPVTGKKRAIQMAPKGTADLLALPGYVARGGEWHCVPLWIETKAPGGKLTADQKIFRDERLADSHYYIVARSVDDVKEWLKQFGF